MSAAWYVLNETLGTVKKWAAYVIEKPMWEIGKEGR
jgi:hypothetical protein